MKHFASVLLAIVVLVCCYSCRKTATEEPNFVAIRDGQFYIGDSAYRYIGTNMWYGAILGSQGRGGDRQRLVRELDALQDLGVNNIRVLVGADGAENLPAHVMPILQTEPGVYNDTILDGLDYFMAELEKRGMTAVLYLNNSWEWSGGYGEYLRWSGHGPCPIPGIDGYNTYVDHVAQFVHDDSAKAMFADHVRFIVGRTNRYTGKPYTESPALMSWQICNEPRAFASDSLSKRLFAEWIASTASLIKSMDRNHLFSTGSEGLYGCQVDLDLWTEIHSNPDVDYGLIHMWPVTWNWARRDSLWQDTDSAAKYSTEYVMAHVNALRPTGKPLVLEEFGYPRDGMSYDVASTTRARDEYYKYAFSLMDSNLIQGCNFWAWGGEVVPAHETWQAWDPYTGDPAQEPQGLYSVFSTDSSTISVIRAAADRVRQAGR